MKTLLFAFGALCAGAGAYWLVAGDTASMHANAMLPEHSSPQEPAMMVAQQGGDADIAQSLPVPREEVRVALPERLELWHSEGKSVRVDGIDGFVIRAPAEVTAQLKMDQLLALPLPHTNATLLAKLHSTHNQGRFAQVWRADILDDAAHSNVIIVKGEIETHITVATESATYIAIIDNTTGRGTIVDQSDIIEGQLPVDDAIPVEPIDVAPPVLSVVEYRHD